MKQEKFEIEIAGQKMELIFSPLAQQANGAVLARLGETVVLATAVMAKEEKPEIDYLPLTVDFEEKYYAAGKIYGSRFIRRESRPTENAILTGRLIDRTIRPRFDKNLRHDIQIIVTCLSIDEKNDPDLPAILAASSALLISDIPWNGPVAAARVGWSKETGFVINPDYALRENLEMDLLVSGTREKINMLEAQAKGVSEEIVKEGLILAQEQIKKLIDFQLNLPPHLFKEKIALTEKTTSEELVNWLKNFLADKLEAVVYSGEKTSREDKMFELKKSLSEALKEAGYNDADYKKALAILDQEIDSLVHQKVLLEGKRPDGRQLDEVRPLDIYIDILPRAHGSALFIRGLTQALSVVTLGTPSDALTLQGMEMVGTKRFMHHYNFPPYCSGEVGRLGSPGRREIGHGALAEKALLAVIPNKEEFPYTIRVVTEILSSNGSTSMASVCASSLALMAAGVPIKEPVAGIAMGLMSDTEGHYKILTDIQGPEDHHGDMDLKAAGTKDGLTALQMDVKIEGLSPEIIYEALEQAKKARMLILDKMNAVIDKPRLELSSYAPKIEFFKIDPLRIGEVIGSGGRIINRIINETGVTIDIDEEGYVYIAGQNESSVAKAKEMIDEILHEYKAGEVVEGKVLEIRDFGAILSLGSAKEGLLHISELRPYRVDKVSDILKPGDVVKVKIKKIENGKISLSLKDMMTEKPETRFRPPTRKPYKKPRR